MFIYICKCDFISYSVAVFVVAVAFCKRNQVKCSPHRKLNRIKRTREKKTEKNSIIMNINFFKIVFNLSRERENKVGGLS